MSTASPQAFPQAYGKYELLERIGEGGMAEVFRARLPGAAGFEKILVVKRILPHLAKKPDFVRMFVDEAKLAAKVQHQNVVQVFELGEAEGGELYMAMEHIAGVDLRRLLVNARERRLRIPVWFVLHTLAEVLNGLTYAHELVDADGHPLHVVHRDVTPGNIFISFQGEVKLADFGIAKAVGRVSETEAGQVKGNAPFMAPEAIYGRTLDARADVFSAGVVLWASLALRLPFEGSSNYETAKLVCEAKREPPSKYNPLVTPELDAVALQALEIERSRRIPSAREFQARILELLARMRPKLLPSDVRHVVDVLTGRKAPDAQFADQRPTSVTLRHDGHATVSEVLDVRMETPIWSGRNQADPGSTATQPMEARRDPPRRPPSTAEAQELAGDLDLPPRRATPEPPAPRPTPPPQPAMPPPQPAWPPIGSPLTAPHVVQNLPAPVVAPTVSGSFPPVTMVPAQVAPMTSAPLLGVPAQYAYDDHPYVPAQDEMFGDLPDEPLELPNTSLVTGPIPVAPMYNYARPQQPPPPQQQQQRMPVFQGAVPRDDDQDLLLHDVPLASMLDFMGDPGGPIAELQREVERYYNDNNKFLVRFQDGSVLTANGFDECLSLCDPWGRNAVAVSIDNIAWMELPQFARLAGLDYLAPDTSPLKNVTTVGLLEERSLVSVFVQLSKSRASGRLVIMDKGVHKVARRELDVVNGAPVYAYADHPSLQIPHLLVQHKLVKKELVPDLMIQVLKQRQSIEEVARRTAFVDLNPYRPIFMRDRLAEMFSWRYGRFAFDAGRDVRSGTSFAPSLLRVLPDALQRGYSVEELRRDLEPFMNIKLRRTDQFEPVLADLALKDKLAVAARRLGQKNAISAVTKKYPTETHATLTLARILLELEVLVPA